MSQINNKTPQQPARLSYDEFAESVLKWVRGAVDTYDKKKTIFPLRKPKKWDEATANVIIEGGYQLFTANMDIMTVSYITAKAMIHLMEGKEKRYLGLMQIISMNFITHSVDMVQKVLIEQKKQQQQQSRIVKPGAGDINKFGKNRNN